jgi:hypothetical protein
MKAGSATYESITMNTLLLPLLIAATEVVGGYSLISVLIWLLIFAVVVYLVFLILGMLPLPEPIRTVITIVVALILLLVLLQRIGFF